MAQWDLLIFVLLFNFVFWLGLYLINRDRRRVLLWTAGLALLANAGVLATGILNQYALSIRQAFSLLRAQQLFILCVSFFILVTLIAIAPKYDSFQHRWEQQRRPFILIWLSLLVIALAVGLIVFVGQLVAQDAHVVLLTAGVLGLGLGVSQIAASDLGEAWLPHILRSADYSIFTAVLFGGQVALIMIYAVGINFPLLVLLLATMGTAIIVQVFAGGVQTAVDKIAFASYPAIRAGRSTLRSESEALQRVDTSIDLDEMAEDEFVRHTRRALSQMGNLPKLAANPLTRLPLVDRRLSNDGAATSTLSRATELQVVLGESIAGLKPPGERSFGTTDAWRHYNSLYYPYVKGLRPYSRRLPYEQNGEQNGEVVEALSWFRTQVPERTLRNWQNAAARLVARDLRERSLQRA